jgi:purine-nucleoside phosphorylase
MEELETALSHCAARTRRKCQGVQLWTAEIQNVSFHFLKTGVGPERSGNALEKTLRSLRPSSILVIGYAGALDGELRLGELAVIRRVAWLGENEEHPASLEDANLAETWDLAESSSLLKIAQGTGMPAHLCDGVTSPHIIGEPGQKRLLHSRFGMSVIDMETAALARVAAANEIPLGCVRSVSDEAGDSFLAPFTYDPASTPVRRAARVLSAGNWVRRYGEWRKRAAIARESLRRFMAACLAR